MLEHYFVVELLGEFTQEEINELNLVAHQYFSCGGLEEFDLNEADIDTMIGAKSLCGQSPSSQLMNEVEQKAKKQQSIKPYRFFFYEESMEEDAHRFSIMLEDSFGEEIKTLVKKKENENWNESWKEHYRPIYISDKIEIVPAFLQKEYQLQSEIPVYINPAMGFGTGTHATTYLCLKLALEALETEDNQKRSLKLDHNSKILDFGCGSGILGIAIEKILKKEKYENVRCDYFDIDEQALENCHENLELNDIQNITLENRVFINKDDLNGPYELVFANILLDALKSEYETLVTCVAAGGHLLLSGVLENQIKELLAYFSKDNYFELVNMEIKESWGCLHLIKK